MTQPRPHLRPRVTAQQLALEHIRGLISSGAMRPDDHIRQEQLAAELGTSVVPVREALKTLEAEGQVTYIPHRGFQVTRLSLQELQETYEIRRLLEDEVVRIAGPRLTDRHFDGLEAAMGAMEDAGRARDVPAMIAANHDFHFTVFEAADRPRMVEFIRLLWQSTDAYRTLYYSEAGARRRVDDEHRAIVSALREGRVGDAIRLLEEHRQHAVADLATRFEVGAGS